MSTPRDNFFLNYLYISKFKIIFLFKYPYLYPSKDLLSKIRIVDNDI